LGEIKACFRAVVKRQDRAHLCGLLASIPTRTEYWAFGALNDHLWVNQKVSIEILYKANQTKTGLGLIRIIVQTCPFAICSLYFNVHDWGFKHFFLFYVGLNCQ
jgi:O-glycosyl hydrolase